MPPRKPTVAVRSNNPIKIFDMERKDIRYEYS